MAIDRLNGSKTTDHLNELRKLTQTKPKPRIDTVPQNVDRTRVDENKFTSSIQRQRLIDKFVGGSNGAGLTVGSGLTRVEPVKHEINFFDIDKQADELIAKHTKDGIFSDSLKTDPLGQELAEIARTEPERAAALTNNILDKIAGSDKDEVAQSFVESMSPAELREFAGNERGAEVLGELKDHLLSGSVWGNERDTAGRIDAAIKAAEFQQSPEFKNLSPEAQANVLQRIDSNETDKRAVDNIIRLAQNGDFASLPIATQDRMLDGLEANKDDRIFVDGLINTAGNADFQGLTAKQQANVIRDMETFATLESYQGKEGGIFGRGRREVNDDSKTYLLGLIAGTSIYSEQNPGNTAVSNSLDKILSGEVKMESYFNNTDGATVNGNASDGTIRMNRFANSTRTIDQQIDTYVHEINHIVNGDTSAGTPERFLDEYRARVVGREAGGRPLDVDIQRSSLTQLSTNGGSSYGHLNNLYRDNADFRAVIDDALAGLDETPPRLTTPEQLRQNLLDAGFDSEYLKTPSNLDNH